MKLTIYLNNGKTLRFNHVQVIVGGIILETPFISPVKNLDFVYISESRPEEGKQKASFRLSNIAGYSYDFK